MAICWERAVPLAFHLCCVNFSAVLVVRVPFPFGVWGRMWNSIVSVPDHCLFLSTLCTFSMHDLTCCKFRSTTFNSVGGVAETDSAMSLL